MPNHFTEDDTLDPDLRSAVQAWSDEQEAALTGHPEVEVLIAYQEGQLDETTAPSVREHLVACDGCRQELRDLDTFDASVTDDDRVPTTEQTEASWHRFDAARSATVRVTEPMAPRPPRSWGPRSWLLAALIPLALSAATFLGMQIERARGTGIAVAAGDGSPVLITLEPVGATTSRDAAAVREIEIPATSGPVVVTLELGDLTPHDTYTAEVFDDRGTRIIRRVKLRRDRQGRIPFLVAREAWPAGDYRIELLGLRDGKAQPMATYRLKLITSP